jgi:neutral amino acid transport system permease protein
VPDVTQVAGFVANGLVIGSILALGAVGLTLVYGILRLANFAHGDFLALGAFLSLFFGVDLVHRLPAAGFLVAAALAIAALAGHRRLAPAERGALWGATAVVALATTWAFAAGTDGGTTTPVLVAATVLAMTVTAALVGFDFALWRPLRRRGATVLTLIIVSIGLSLVLRNVLLMHFGGGNRFYERPLPEAPLLLGVRVSEAQQFTFVTALLVILAVHLFLRHTRLGKAMRALSDNADLARASGIDVDRVVLYVWILAGALTALAGVLLSLVLNNTMNVHMGFVYLLPLFASVILGGIGSPYGAIAGGLIVGVALKTSALWLGTQYELASAFLILILVMLVRPQGLFGGRLQ